MKCKRCQNDIRILNLKEEQKLELSYLVQNDLMMFAIDRTKNYLNCYSNEAKIIINHINKSFGNCIRCNFNKLDKENIECPKCKAFNYNFLEPSFNAEFCLQLEYKLDFEQLIDPVFYGYWCDGISQYPKDIKSLSIENIKKNKSITVQAYSGESGQDIFEMKIKFGKISLERYLNRKSMVDCIPTKEDPVWVKVDDKAKTIEVKLL